MAVLRKCCCCCNVKTGTIILGTLGLVGGLMAIVTLSFALYNQQNVATIVEQVLNHIPTNLETETAPNDNTKENKDKTINLQDSKLQEYSTYVIAGAIVLEFICALISGMLILGAVKGRRNFLLPWLIYILIVILATTAASILAVVMLDTMYGVSILVVGILQLLFMIWYWLVVFSLFQELRERDQMIINSPAEAKRLTSQC